MKNLCSLLIYSIFSLYNCISPCNWYNGVTRTIFPVFMRLSGFSPGVTRPPGLGNLPTACPFVPAYAGSSLGGVFFSRVYSIFTPSWSSSTAISTAMILFGSGAITPPLFNMYVVLVVQVDILLTWQSDNLISMLTSQASIQITLLLMKNLKKIDGFHIKNRQPSRSTLELIHLRPFE